MLRALMVVGLAIGTIGLFVDIQSQAGAKKEPASIKYVMRVAMKGGKDMLCAKVLSGKANDAEKKHLVALFTDLAANKSPKGDAADWKVRTAALLDAAKSDDVKALKKAVDCTGCHNSHK
jgi:hypothetical protein